MTLLESIHEPRDLRGLDDDQLDTLATEIRDVLVRTCARTGGHLGPNLGVVELTMAIHRVFDSPVDRVVFDTGHQAYVHKLLTGRAASFDTLRQEGGLSGYPSREESPLDSQTFWLRLTYRVSAPFSYISSNPRVSTGLKSDNDADYTQQLCHTLALVDALIQHGLTIFAPNTAFGQLCAR